MDQDNLVTTITISMKDWNDTLDVLGGHLVCTQRK